MISLWGMRGKGIKFADRPVSMRPRPAPAERANVDDHPDRQANIVA